MSVSQSVKLAGTLVLLIILYFLVRGMFGSTQPIAEAQSANNAITVIAADISPEAWSDEVSIQGRTKAEINVIVRAETSGVVAETPARLGAMVSEGDTLCRLNVDARRARVAEAQAALAKARLDYEAALKLGESGFRSETGVAAAKANRDQTAAQAEQATLELEKTNITAPFHGIYDQRFAEVGDFLSIGDPCATVIKFDPFLVVGSVSEKDVGKINVGNRGMAKLATGETVEGTVRFVSSSASPATRTFNVELEIPNADGSLKDGVTADFTVYAENKNAYFLPRSSLVLNDSGNIGIRTVNNDNVVKFMPVAIVGETADGVWVNGPSGDIRVIVRGQEYVDAGRTVVVELRDLAPNGSESSVK